MYPASSGEHRPDAHCQHNQREDIKLWTTLIKIRHNLISSLGLLLSAWLHLPYLTLHTLPRHSAGAYVAIQVNMHNYMTSSTCDWRPADDFAVALHWFNKFLTAVHYLLQITITCTSGPSDITALPTVMCSHSRNGHDRTHSQCLWCTPTVS